MSLDPVMMPVVPQSPAAGTHHSQSADAASFKFNRSAKTDDRQKSFLATLNRVSERKSACPASSRSHGAASAKSQRPNREPAQSVHTDPGANQQVTRDSSVSPEMTASIPEKPLLAEPSANGMLPELLLHLLFTDDATFIGQSPSDDSGGSSPAVLNQMMGRLYAELPAPLDGRVGIGHFEQLQTGIAPQASNLAYLRHLVNRAIVQQFAPESPGARSENPFFEFWQTLTTAAPEGAIAGGRTEALVSRANELIQYLLQRYDNAAATSGSETATTETNAPKAAANAPMMEALSSHASRLPLKGAGAPGTAPPPTPATSSLGTPKDIHLSTAAPRNLSLESRLEPQPHTNHEPSQPLKSSPMPNAAEPAHNTNLVAEGLPAKPPLQEAVNVRFAGPQNEMVSPDPSVSKIIQMDGEAKDSGFTASQENLPEHIAKLESGGRSAESAGRSLASQTLHQIVQKAVLLNSNGQSTIQIDLKPEFLGHIRMQIITENHQVAIRIMAEIPFVKEMLENNLNQLKAELQAQGLEVDELEVSVAHDSRADDELYQKAAEARRARASQNNRQRAETDAQEQGHQKPAHGYATADTAIDFFA